MIFSLAIDDIKHLRRILTIVSKFAPEPVLQVHETGLYIYSQNHDHLVDLRLDASYFYEYEVVRPCTVKFDINLLNKLLRVFGNTMPFVHIYMEDIEHLIAAGGNKQFKIKVEDYQMLRGKDRDIQQRTFDLKLPLGDGRFEDIRGIIRNFEGDDDMEIHQISDKFVEFWCIDTGHESATTHS